MYPFVTSQFVCFRRTSAFGRTDVIAAKLAFPSSKRSLHPLLHAFARRAGVITRSDNVVHAGEKMNADERVTRKPVEIPVGIWRSSKAPIMLLLAQVISRQ